MTKKYTLLLLLSFTIIHFTIAQDMSKKLRLHSISSLGLVNGSKGTSGMIQTIFGASYQKTFLGIGGGLDYYRYRSIPVFVDLRYEFGKGDRNFFLYGDLGYNYDWLVNEKTERTNIYELENNFSGGQYYDAGAGYKIGITKHDAFVLSGGYTLKKLKSEVPGMSCSLIGTCHNEIQTYRYYLSRFVIKAGWQF